MLMSEDIPAKILNRNIVIGRITKFVNLLLTSDARMGCYKFDVDVWLSVYVYVCLRHRSSQTDGLISMWFFFSFQSQFSYIGP